MHLGVGIIIRNKTGNLFFIQEKDETYPVERYRNCCSFFGGKIEEGETPLEGLKRELVEEVDLGDLIHRMDIRFIRSFFIQRGNARDCIDAKHGISTFEFNLFEGVLNDDDFGLLKDFEIFEGRSKLLAKDFLMNVDWIWGLEEVVEFYVSGDF